MLKPRKDTVIGVVIPNGAPSLTLWTPNLKRKSGSLLEVHYVGAECTDVQVGHIVVLHPDWAGTELKISQDDGSFIIYTIVQESHCLATYRSESVA